MRARTRRWSLIGAGAVVAVGLGFAANLLRSPADAPAIDPVPDAAEQEPDPVPEPEPEPAPEQEPETQPAPPPETEPETEPELEPPPRPEADPEREPAPPSEPEPPAPKPPPAPDRGTDRTWDGTLPPSLRGAEWDRIPTDQRVIALTFDAGANADGVRSILATLEQTGTPATFFLTGRFVANFPDETARIAAHYPVGNHTQDHPDLTTLSDADVRSQVDLAETAITAAAGRSPQPLFRFPFGARDSRTIGIVNDAGYGGFRWTVDTLGWQGTSGGRSADTVLQRVLDTAGPGQIVLLHVGSHPTDGSTLDADALPRIIEELTERGFTFVSLPDALDLAAR